MRKGVEEEMGVQLGWSGGVVQEETRTGTYRLGRSRESEEESFVRKCVKARARLMSQQCF